MDKEMKHSLAWEMLTEVKASAKRWFIAFCIMIGLEIATIGGFMWYISLPVEETENIEQESDNDSYNQVIGGDYNGKSADSDEDKEESSESSQRRDK